MPGDSVPSVNCEGAGEVATTLVDGIPQKGALPPFFPPEDIAMIVGN
jgi:hypothetical protein